MTQYTWVTLDPNVHGGTFLSSQLNSWKGAVQTNHKGPSRPSYAADGMVWFKEVSGTVVEMNFYDGAGDIKIGTINPSANTFVPEGVPVADAIPKGAIMPYGGSAAPSGWVLCHGQAISRTTFSALFAVISTTYGAGDGSTTFNVPDLRGRVPAGVDNMGGSAAGRLTGTVMSPDGNTRGATGGSQTHTLSTGEMPSHNHGIDGKANGVIGPQAFFLRSTLADGVDSDLNSKNTGSGTAHNNTQPTIMLNYIIKT